MHVSLVCMLSTVVELPKYLPKSVYAQVKEQPDMAIYNFCLLSQLICSENLF